LENNKDYFFDKLKSRIENGEHAFQEEDWNLLEPRLKEHKRRVWLFRLSFLLIILSLISLMGLWAYESKRSDFSKFLGKTPKTLNLAYFKGTHSSSVDLGEKKLRQISHESIVPSEKDIVSLDLARISPILKKNKPKGIERAKIPVFQKAYGDQLAKNPISVNKVIHRKFTRLSQTINRNGRHIILKKDENIPVPDSILNNVQVLTHTIQPLDSLFLSHEEWNLPDYPLMPLKAESYLSLNSKKPKGNHKFNKPENYWMVRILTSPDFNSVGSLNSTKVAFNYGLKIGYNLSDRWRISAGILYGPKLYQASPNDYQNSSFPQTWTHLSSIDANCKVIDLPIDIGYSFYKKDRSQFYLSLGLSTYFMHEETYTINYSVGTVSSKTGLPISSYTYSVYNKNKNLLSVADLVLDYHYRINDRSSFGLSPYLKIPFSGVGLGSLSLVSFGTSLSLNFNLGFSH